MFGLKRRAAVFTLVFSGLLPSMALACACCADPGQRSTTTQAMNGYVAAVFADLRFGPVANVFVSPCDIECVRGIENPDYAYDLTVKTSGEAFSLTLIGTENGSLGTMHLRTPKEITAFATDRKPDPTTLTTILYKEWRMKTSVTGGGAFAKLSNTNAELILIGSGNSCDSDADFTHWMLDVSGEDVDFRLFGAMQP